MIFVSCATYELGKRLGIEAAAREFVRMCEQPQRGDLAAARMVARVRAAGLGHDVTLYHGAGTQLPKLRSRAAAAAWASGADYWLMVDDDVECDSQTLRSLFVAARDPKEAAVIVLPCLLRGVGIERQTVNVKFEPGQLIALMRGAPVRSVSAAGCGCMLVTRAALEQVRDCFAAERIWWDDDDGARKPALFACVFEGCSADSNEPTSWLGEDLSFVRRLREASVPVFALLSGISVHDDLALQLESIA